MVVSAAVLSSAGSSISVGSEGSGMKGFAIFLIMVAACFLLANIMISDHGYVLIAFNDMTFESSLWGLSLLVALVIGAIWLTIGAVKMLLATLGFVVPLSARAKKRRAR